MSDTGPRDRPARWWSASLPRRPILDLLGSWSAPVGWATAALTFSGCAEMLAETPDEAKRDEAMQAALDQQQQDGWNVGGEGQPMIFPGAQTFDVAGSVGWRDMMATLALRLTPAGARWAPYYNPTLFQSLEAPRNNDLRAIMRPIFTPEMALAARRARRCCRC